MAIFGSVYWLLNHNYYIQTTVVSSFKASSLLLYDGVRTCDLVVVERG